MSISSMTSGMFATSRVMLWNVAIFVCTDASVAFRSSASSNESV